MTSAIVGIAVAPVLARRVGECSPAFQERRDAAQPGTPPPPLLGANGAGVASRWATLESEAFVIGIGRIRRPSR